MAASKEFSLLTKLTLSAAGFNTGIEQAKKKTNDLTNATETASDSIKSSFSGLAGLAGGLTDGLSGLQGVITGGINAFKGMKGALVGVKGALISTGIGALVVVLGLAFAALTSYLSGTSEGANKLKEAFAYVQGAIDAILKRLKTLGESIVELFSGNFKNAAKLLGDAFAGGLGDEIVESAIKQNEITKKGNDLKKEGRKMAIYEIENLRKIDNLRQEGTNADDQTVEGMKKKGVLLDKAAKLAVVTHNNIVRFAKKELELQAEIMKKKGDSATDEDWAAYTAAIQKYNEALTNQKDINTQISDERLQNKNDTLSLIDEQKANIKALYDSHTAYTNYFLKNDADIKNLALQAEVEAYRKAEYEKLDALKNTNQQQKEEIIKAKAEIDAIANDKLTTGKKNIKNDEDLKDISIRKTSNSNETSLLNDRLANQLITQKEYNQKIKALEKQATEDSLAELKIKLDKKEISKKEYNQTVKDIHNKAAQNEIIANKSVWTKIADNYRDGANKVALYSNAIDTVSTALVSLATDGKASFKGLVLSMLAGLRQIINGLLAQAIAGQIATNSKFGIPGLVMAMVGVAGVEALFASLPAFNNGGIVNGNSYSGDKVLARVNSGELILNQKQQSRLFDLANNSDNNYNSNNNYNNVSFRISGNDLVGVLERFNKKNQNFR